MRKSAIIFGGSRGIGRTVAEAFIACDFGVTIVARSVEQAQETTEKLSKDGLVQCFSADISEISLVKSALMAHLEKFNGLEVVINTAARQGPIGLLWENDPEDWGNTIRINLLGSFNICHAVIPVMLEQGHGTLILFSGGGAAYARSHFSAYGTSKTAVLRLVETVHEELKEQDKISAIKIYAIAPGAVKTRMTDEVLSRRDSAGEQAFQEALKANADGGTSPGKAAALCLFLAHRRPFCLSGRLIHVNEPYREYVEKFEGKELAASGMLRRQGYNIKEF